MRAIIFIFFSLFYMPLDALLSEFNLPPHTSYAQETIQQTIDDQLIDHLLATSPKLKTFVTRLQNPLIYGKAMPHRLLLVGPPGVGKTTLAKGIAHRIERPYKFLRASLLINEYKNSGAQNLARELTPIIKQEKPYVIIIDELHALTENYKKDHNADPGTAEALWSLLDECAKNPYILFIGTTNDAANLPEPLKTRFANCIIKIPLPTFEQRKDILRYYLRNLLFDGRYKDFNEIAYKTKNMPGRTFGTIN